MTNKLRKNAFLLFKQVLIFDLIFFIVFFATNFYIDYEGLEDKSPISYILTTDIVTLSIFLLVSLLITLFIFVRWHLDTVKISSSSLQYRKYPFLKKFEIDFKDIESVSFEQSILEEFFESGTIHLKVLPDRKNVKLSNLNDAEYYANLLKQYTISNKNQILKSEEEIYKLISQGEYKNIEFKSSLRWDTKLNNVNKEIEKAIMKTVCGFMNAEGGMLFIGVNNEGKIIGIEDDYKTLRKYGKDYFEVHFYQLVKQMIGKEYMHLIDVTFYNLEGMDICLVCVPSSEKTVYLRSDNQEAFYVRVGNTTQPLTMREAENYIKSHWKG
jgi:hypothetical protein